MMIYSTLTLGEVERAAYIDPTNQEAKSELVARHLALDFSAEDFERVTENCSQAEGELKALQEEYDKGEEINTELRAENEVLENEIDALNAKLAELTRAEELV